MPIKQKVFAIILSIFLIIVIIELVRQRKLREEYSWLWILTGFSLLLLVIWHDLLVKITTFIGAVLPTSTLFFFGLIFMILINIHYSVKISALTTQIKNITQEITLLKADIEVTGGKQGTAGVTDNPSN
jgi:hypothetical protein